MDKENNNMEDFIEIKDEKQQQSLSTDSNIEQKIRGVYLNKSEISEEKSDKNQQDNKITNFDTAKSDANQNQQEKNKHLKFRVLIALFGLLGIIMILYFLFPQIDVTNQEILNTQQTTIDNQNNLNNQNLNTGQSSTSGSETNKEIVLEEYKSAIGKEARVGFAKYTYDQESNTVIGTFVTSYLFKIENITTNEKTIKGDKTINVYFSVRNLASNLGENNQLLLIKNNGELYYSSCHYVTPPKEVKNVKCTFFVPETSGFSAIGIMKEHGYEKQGIEKMFNLN